jgi:ubiquinone/menaquinone biosynthesis C-methylase UbiE/rhodanese-related sulfurtransferase
MRPVRFQTLVSAIGFTLLLPAVAPVAGFQSPRDPARLPAASTDRIPADELAALVARDAVVIVDVREPELFRRGHLPKALPAPPERWRDVALALKSQPRTVVTYCSCPQEESSLRAATKFRDLGVLNVRALTGGYEGWAESGRPVVKPAPGPAIAPGPTPAPAANPSAPSAAAPAQDGGRDAWQRVPDIITALGIAAGSRVADVGAGDGYFTTRLAAAVGTEGRVYAVDVSKNALDRLGKRVSAAGLGNVELILGTTSDPHLPAGTLDAALIVNAYHEMREHQSMLAGIKRALKPGGRLVILESVAVTQRNIPRDAQESRHQLAAHYLQQDALQAGFQVARFEDPFTRPHTRAPEYLLVLTPIAATVDAPPEPAHDHAADETWRKPDEVVAALQLRSGMTVVDLGAGSGVFTRRFARAIGPTGRAIGLDVDPNAVAAMTKDAASAGLANYEARLVKPEDPAIPAASADVVFVSNAYHHLDDRVAYFTRLRPSLKPGGRLVIVDFAPGQMGDMVHPDRPQVERELHAAGYRLVRAHEFLPRQFFLEFVAR